MRKKLALISASLLTWTGLFGLATPTLVGAAAVETSWLTQFGPVSESLLTSVGSDDSIYVAGTVSRANLPGQPAFGLDDGFIRKYDSAGNEVWTHQIGTSGFDYIQGLDVDETGVYIFGSTSESFDGDPNRGIVDAYIIKYDLSGEQLWAVQFGSTRDEYVWAGAVSGDGVYVAGQTGGNLVGNSNLSGYDMFVAKYNPSDGSEIWVDQFGTDSEYDGAYSLHADDNGVYVAGTASDLGTTALEGNSVIGGGDAFLRMYESDGTVLWTEQFGTTSYEQVVGVSTDATGIFVAGESYGAFSSETQEGQGDAFVAKFDFTGNELWHDQFGTDVYDSTFGIASDTSGMYVSGHTSGSLPTFTNQGGEDAFVRKYDSDGAVKWTEQYGTDGNDQGQRIAIDENGLILTGRTTGSFPGQTNTGIMDFYLMRMVQEDTDSDSIFDAVDADARVVSDDYTDGTTTGTILDRGDQTLSIQDAADPAEGVLMSAAVGGGAAPAAMQSCAGAATTYLDAGDEATVTCGSAIIKVLNGVVETVFTADNGTVATVELDSGNEVTFKPELATITAAPENVSEVEVVVNGSTVTVQPGEIQPVFKTIQIDIKPGSSQNSISLSGNGVIPVAVLTTSEFNAADVDPMSLKLEGAAVRVHGRSGKVGSMTDIDHDGDLDLLIQMENSLQLIPGSTTAKLTGKTKDGIPIGGSDSIQIVN